MARILAHDAAQLTRIEALEQQLSSESPQPDPSVDTSYTGQIKTLTAKLAEVERTSQKMTEALQDIANYGKDHDGCCPYGCDTPYIAQQTLANKVTPHDYTGGTNDANPR